MAASRRSPRADRSQTSRQGSAGALRQKPRRPNPVRREHSAARPDAVVDEKQRPFSSPTPCGRLAAVRAPPRSELARSMGWVNGLARDKAPRRFPLWNPAWRRRTSTWTLLWRQTARIGGLKTPDHPVSLRHWRRASARAAPRGLTMSHAGRARLCNFPQEKLPDRPEHVLNTPK